MKTVNVLMYFIDWKGMGKGGQWGDHHVIDVGSTNPGLGTAQLLHIFK
jgi:hypothetical protein